MKIPLICCTWKHRSSLPATIKSKFQDLDELIRRLITQSNKQVIIVSPYISPAGINNLKNSIAIASQNGAWIRLLTSDLEDGESLNRKAIKELVLGDNGKIIERRLRVLTGSDNTPELFHSKLILSDSEKGYLGSANISFSGFEKNFEVGVELNKGDVEALCELISYMESEGMLVDVTEKVLAL